MALTDIQLRALATRPVHRAGLTITPTQFRTTGDTAQFSGVAAEMGVAYLCEDFLGVYDETLKPGSVTRALTRQGQTKRVVPLYLAHDATSIPLASWPNSLQIREVGNQLQVFGTLDLTSPYVLSVAKSIEKGDLAQMSFAMRAIDQQWNDSYDQRTIIDLDLLDVTVCPNGMNPNTSAALDVSRAIAIVTDHRSGKVLSKTNLAMLTAAQNHLAQAAEHLGNIATSAKPKNSNVASNGSGLDSDASDANGASSDSDSDGLGTRGTVPASVAAARHELERMKRGSYGKSTKRFAPGVQKAADDLFVWEMTKAGGNVKIMAGYEPTPEALRRIEQIRRRVK